VLAVSAVGNYYDKDTTCKDVLEYDSVPRDVSTGLERLHTFVTSNQTNELLLLAERAGLFLSV
jgi:hypothetical protein